MKSNAVLLTIITTVSALALGLLSLSYISYYSAEKTAKLTVPSDFILTDTQEAEQFKEVLHAKGLSFTEKRIEVLQVDANIENLLGNQAIEMMSENTTLSVISEHSLEGIDLSPDEAYFTKTNGAMENLISMKDKGTIEFKGMHEIIPQAYQRIEMGAPIAWFFTGGLPVTIVDETTFERLKKDLDPALQKKYNLNIGIDMKDRSSVEQANELFQHIHFKEGSRFDSQLETKNSQKENMGLIMFIVAFLGLTFLITSGCILYFKQMDESENEKPNYTILRKLGFTQGDLLRGIQMKQLFNFGIPLVIGLFHSYFAVKSGWFLFGTELWTPMILVMLLYTGLYSIFAVLSVFYYKKVIKEAL